MELRLQWLLLLLAFLLVLYILFLPAIMRGMTYEGVQAIQSRCVCVRTVVVHYVSNT
jgi:hypothetical protein